MMVMVVMRAMDLWGACLFTCDCEEVEKVSRYHERLDLNTNYRVFG